MFKFGWLTVTAEDIAIWMQFPSAAFTLVPVEPREDGEEYCLGSYPGPLAKTVDLDGESQSRQDGQRSLMASATGDDSQDGSGRSAGLDVN
jgi:hypothetical protein